MRVFFGILCLDIQKQALATAQSHLKQKGLAGNYTLVDNLHLTLRFIGEVTPLQLLKLSQVLKNVAKETAPFTIDFGGLDRFLARNKSVIYVSVKKSNELMRLYQLLNNTIKQININLPVPSYSPHITLAREVDLKAFALLEGLGVNIPKQYVQEIALLESVRQNGVLRYLPIKLEQLGKE